VTLSLPARKWHSSSMMIEVTSLGVVSGIRWASSDVDYAFDAPSHRERGSDPFTDNWLVAVFNRGRSAQPAAGCSCLPVRAEAAGIRLSVTPSADRAHASSTRPLSRAIYRWRSVGLSRLMVGASSRWA
jgi:hypothetical protein